MTLKPKDTIHKYMYITLFFVLNLRILNARPQHVAYIDETNNLCCG